MDYAALGAATQAAAESRRAQIAEQIRRMRADAGAFSRSPLPVAPGAGAAAGSGGGGGGGGFFGSPLAASSSSAMSPFVVAMPFAADAAAAAASYAHSPAGFGASSRCDQVPVQCRPRPSCARL